MKHQWIAVAAFAAMPLHAEDVYRCEQRGKAPSYQDYPCGQPPPFRVTVVPAYRPPPPAPGCWIYDQDRRIAKGAREATINNWDGARFSDRERADEAYLRDNHCPEAQGLE